MLTLLAAKFFLLPAMDVREQQESVAVTEMQKGIDANIARQKYLNSIPSEEAVASIDQAVLDITKLSFYGPHGVKVSLLAPKKTTQSGEFLVSLNNSGEPVPETTWKKIDIDIGGSYSSLEGFKSYLAELKKLSAVVSSLEMKKNIFNLKLTVFIDKGKS